jgi:hypothetical protein
MRKQLKTIIGASVLTAGLLAAPVILYAHEDSGGMMGSGNMMGNDSMMGQGSGGMMGGQGGDMMGMMNMMGQMAQNCNAMMTSMMTTHGTAPNQQWKRSQPPAAPEHHD